MGTFGPNVRGDSPAPKSHPPPTPVRLSLFLCVSLLTPVDLEPGLGKALGLALDPAEGLGPGL
jgi:hypothetical protein